MKEKKAKKDKKDRKDTKKRSLFARIIIGLLSVLAFVGLLAMAMSVLCSYVNPVRFVWLSFFGLLFWVILFYNLTFLLLLLLMRTRKVWIAIVALLIAIPGICKSLSTGNSHGEGDLLVMSYNVMLFDDFHNEGRKREAMATNMVNMVKEYQPDVLCLQEFGICFPKTNRKACVAKLGEMMEMPYHYYHNKANFCRNVIFSRYPLSALEEDTPFAQENRYGAVACVDAGSKGVFYVLNCHLTSFLLTKSELEVLEPGNNKEQVEKYGKSIVSKLVTAYQKRSQEVGEMLEHIPHDGRPLLLCGDFNDTPLSYTYHRINSSGFSDGFVKAGRGIGHTYAGKLPLLRIDYIWANEQIQPMSFKRLRYKGSDHYPVMMDFNVNHGL